MKNFLTLHSSCSAGHAPNVHSRVRAGGGSLRGHPVEESRYLGLARIWLLGKVGGRMQDALGRLSCFAGGVLDLLYLVADAPREVGRRLYRRADVAHRGTLV